MEFDFIIVGGGSAGCVLANRLSAAPTRKVLLCEAGPDLREASTPAVIADSYGGKAYIDARYQWAGLNVTTQPASHNHAPDSARPTRKYVQARVLGGGSSINGQLANRGMPSDYEEWVARGAAGWDWESVLPYFKRLETDLDFDGPLHGSDGPIAIRRVPFAHWSGHAKAAAEAFATIGYPQIADQNGDMRDGYFPIAMSNRDDRRVTTATAYLPDHVRARRNLTVMADTVVTRLLFEGKQCVGVEIRHGSEIRAVRAREVILSSGAIYSPAHLLRAGIGPAEDLQRLGIEVIANRPGVGQRLMDHPSVALGGFLKPSARMTYLSRRHMQVGLRYSSGLVEAQGDMFLAAMSRTAWHAVGTQIAAFAVMVNKTMSESGEIKLATPDWRDNPIVHFNLLSDYRDVERLMDGYRRSAALMALPSLKAVHTDAFPASYTDQVIRYGVVSPRNKILTSIGKVLLDGPAVLRRYLLSSMISAEFDYADLLEDDAKLEAFVRQSAIGAWHASCSARMGREDDPMAVVDPDGKVYGVAGLRVADSSIFPVVPRANTNLPAIMCAEKISDALLR